MTRNEFLEKKWNSYPLLPKGVSFFGRIYELRTSENREWILVLSREGEHQSRVFPKIFLKEVPGAAVEKILSVGDLLAVSESGEITLLAPATRKLPTHLLNLDMHRLWQDYIFWIREFFKEQGFVEIQTPGLVACPGTEPSLDVFSTDLVLGSRREKLYLPTSPELHLKKALSLGAEKIFEIKKCYRNGEVTDHHQPEFTMIEWYRAFEDLQAIKKDVVGLVTYLGRKIPALQRPAAVDNFTIAQLFKRDCGFELKPGTSKEQLKDLALKLGVDVASATQIDDYFFLLFLEKIEGHLPPERLTFVENYPPYQAALARLTEEGWGDRFEVYWQGLELANAFHELNDPKVQAQRFQADLAKKKSLGKEIIPLDDEFMQCLEAGMPPSGGIALGVERLFMALVGVKNISETRLFPMKMS